MNDYPEMESLYASLGFDQAFTDLLAILKNNPREYNFESDVSLIRPQDVIPAKSLDLNLVQSAIYQSRLAGEGAEAATLQIGTRKSAINVSLPIIAPSEGWVDPIVATIWDLCKQAWWGSASTAVGHMISPVDDDPILSGQSEIYTDNISDFIPFNLPFSIVITPSVDNGEELEVVNVVEISKRDRKLILENPTQYNHSPLETLLMFFPSFSGPEREPSFSLMSLREGMLTPCLVNKITIEANDIKSPIDLKVEMSYVKTFRQKQIELKNVKQTLLNQLAQKGLGRLIFGSEINLSSFTTPDGTFGLGEAKDNELFGGYQGLSIHPITITGVTITVDNHLKEVYSAHSMSSNLSQRNNENNQPFLLYSEGRTITGSITYKSPLDGWAVLERLVGPSSINNGGLIINFGSFKISMKQVAWTPSTSSGKAEGDVDKKIEWSMLAENYDDMPRLDYAVQI